MLKFSVLMSIYSKENPKFFDDSLISIWDQQTLKPDEIVLVKDGPLTVMLDNVISKWSKKIPKNFKVIELEKNIGLGVALDEGLKHCTNNLVARMDTDDISHHRRFEKQIEFFSKNHDIDIIGSCIAEFDSSPQNIISYRKLPLHHNDIVNFSKKRNPLNHMTVMFKKEAVLNSGSYQSFIGFEDYHLWSRMLNNGKNFANLPDYLVYARTGKGMLSRRRGIQYIKNEFKLQKYFYTNKMIPLHIFLFNVSSKTFVRLLPATVLEKIYLGFLRK